ncbi:hypothetical protein [Paenibacillus sp. sgz500958]|uniref:hypothetical protein n=1 Tax=Paenibacillus sp. sgz500958 TaxID=3242475 RepID=UPI0036D2DB29
MNETSRNNLKILGTTTSVGGYFRNVNVVGEAKFTGDVECQKLSLTGELNINGDLKADTLKLAGKCDIAGRVEGRVLRGTGEIRAFSGIRIEDINLKGSVISTSGCEAEKLHIFGALEVDGLLSADQLELSLYGPSRAKEVGGGTIEIKRSTAAKLKGWVSDITNVYFEADLIEGDNLNLYHTKAAIVRGGRVIIGAESEIGLVEYRDSLEIHKSAVVKQQIKI